MATTNDQAVINLGRLKTYDTLLKAEVAKDVSGLQGQIDSVKAIATSAIETHFGTGVPTADNKPASDWTTADLKNLHIGDLYYDDATGYAYRYMKSGTGEFSWQRISDSDVTKAIEDAKAAKEAATAAQTAADKKIDDVQFNNGTQNGISSSAQVVTYQGKRIVQLGVVLKLKSDGGIVMDEQGAYVDTDVIATKASVDAKQDKLTAGENVTITGNTISAKDTVYTLPPATKTALGGIKVGANLSVSADGTLSADAQSTDISGKQDKLTAGHGIALDGATISAKAAAGSPVTVTAAGIGIADGTTSAKGAVQLSDAVDSTSTTLAATAHAVKQAYDLAAGKQSALTFATDDDINAMFAAQ